MVRDLDANGNTIADYLNGPGIDNKLQQTSGGAASYFLTDHLGSTRALTDPSGNITENLSHDSFGNLTSGSASTRYTYTGREFDADTGLIYYRARWYDPQHGRFVSEDPIGFSGGINLYGYVGNNPTNFIDPLGLEKLILPKDPSGLPPGWKRDFSHKPPHGERWRGPGGDFLDFDRAQPGKPGERRRDHWHYNGGDDHLKPGAEIEVEPACDPEPEKPEPIPFVPLLPKPGPIPRPFPWWRIPLPLLRPPVIPIMVNPCIIVPDFPGCPRRVA